MPFNWLRSMVANWMGLDSYLSTIIFYFCFLLPIRFFVSCLFLVSIGSVKFQYLLNSRSLSFCAAGVFAFVIQKIPPDFRIKAGGIYR